MVCHGCGRNVDHVQVWPLHCSCGYITRDADHARRLWLFDWGDHLARLFAAVGVRKKPGCRCGERQAAANHFGHRVYAFLKRWAVWLAPR